MLNITFQPYLTPATTYNSEIKTVMRSAPPHRTQNYTERYGTQLPNLHRNAAVSLEINEPGLLIDIFG